MIETSTLLLFSGAVLVLLLSPGPNMAFLLAHGLSHGARGALAVALGIFLADLVLTLLTATGVTAMFAAWPPSFDLLRYSGAAYLCWLAIQALHSTESPTLERRSSASLKSIFWAATLNSLLNPKALLFFMVFLPQFVNPTQGSVGTQLMVLGGWLAMVALAFHALLGSAAARVAGRWNQITRHVSFFGWVHASLYLTLAVRLVFLDRPAPR